MANITQLTDSVKKSYIELPDGTFAEKVVAVNSDGTAISGGGGGGGSSSALLVPEDSANQTYILDAPSALGQIYTVVIPYSSSSGNVTFQVAAIPGADVVIFIGGIAGFKNYNINDNGNVGEANSLTIVRYNASAFKIDFVYQGQWLYEGINYAIFVVHGMGYLLAG
jgi:hypothetical protein